MLIEVTTLKIESTAPATILDIDGTLARLGGDHQLLVDMTTFYLEDAPLIFAKIEAAAEGGDADALRCAAHALKGLLLNSGGMRAAQAAQALEDAGHSGVLTNADSLVSTLASELELLTDAIHAFRG